MSVVTYDLQSLSIDGHRVWLVGCTIEYALVPRAQWLQRIRTARMSGFNCIFTSVPWSMHEPARGKVSFDGALNLKSFLELLNTEGMYCVLKVGPYVGHAFSGGGLPAWLSALADVKLREGSRPFLDGCARWFATMMQQVRPFQIAADRESPGQGGPVVLMQVEQQWCCHHESQAADYLGELIRYLREEGCVLPLIEANNCWQEVEGAFSTWQGSEDLTANMRQFRQVQQSPPAQQFPLLISDLPVAEADDKDTAWPIAQALAAGAQLNLNSPQAGGQWAGAMSQLITFASQFDQLFSHLHEKAPHATLATLREDHSPSLIHLAGTQGDVIFLFKNAKDRSQATDVLLSDGQLLTVPWGRDRIAWLACDVNLAGRALLDYTSLRPLAFLNQRMLVLFGPAGSHGVVSIDGALVDVMAPRGAKPALYKSDELTLLVLNENQAATCRIDHKCILIGASEINVAGEPQPARGHTQMIRVTSDGQISAITSKSAAKSRIGRSPRLSAWMTAACDALHQDTRDAFVDIAPASSLDALTPEATHGWYRLKLNSGKSSAKLGGNNLLAPSWGSFITVFHGDKKIAQLDNSPSKLPQPFTLKTSNEITILAAAHDRIRDGWRLGERRGLAGHLYQVRPVKLTKPKTELKRLPDLSPWRSFLRDVSYHAQPATTHWNWVIKPAGRTALLLHLHELPVRVAVLVNGQVVGAYDPIESAGQLSITLEVGRHITNGKNTIALAMMDADDAAGIDPRKHMRIDDAIRNLTAKAVWSFAPCKPPMDEAFASGDKSPKRGLPCWHRATFNVGDAALPLMLESRGSSEGDIWLNGAHLGWLPVKGKLSIDASLVIPDHDNIIDWFDARGTKPQGLQIIPVV